MFFLLKKLVFLVENVYLCKMIKILILMILLHVVDDFVLQPVCLSKLKQKSWWEKQDSYKSLYKHDYMMALLMHSMSWSAMILLPSIFLLNVPGSILLGVFCLNASIHYIVDDEKANKERLNLMADQTSHLIQIVVSWIILCQWL